MIQLNSIGLRADARTQAGEIILCIAADVEALGDISDACHAADADRRLRHILIMMLQHTPQFAPKPGNDCAGLQLDVTG